MITIAWDIDDVLNNLTEEWLATQPAPPPFLSLTCNPPAELLGLSRAQYLESLDHFRATRYAGMRPNTRILEWFKLHGHLARHVALSAVPRTFAPVSASWVLNYFGDWIRSFSFVPSPRPTDSHPRIQRRMPSMLASLA
jgi:hypothetical protein